MRRLSLARAVLAALTASTAITIPVTSAAPIPAQPATDIRPSTRNDPDGDANPFALTQVEEKLFFIAFTDRGPALYVRDITHTEVDGEPVIEMVGKRLRPKLIKPFRKTQEFDDQFVGADIENLGSTGSVTLHGGMYFHLPGSGLYASRGTRGTTKLIAKTDRKDEPDDWMTGLIYVPQSSSTTHQLLFAARDQNRRSKGRELFTSRAREDDTSSNPIFDRKHTGIFTDIQEGEESSDPEEIVASFNHIYFTAISAVTNQREIFLSKDNAEPTPVSENLGFAQGLAVRGDSCFFAGSSTVAGETDLYAATPTETFKITTDGMSPRHITATGLQCLFSGRLGATGRELGRVSFDFNVSPVADINPGPGSSDPDQFLSLEGGSVFLTAFDGTARRLFRADGSVVEMIRANDGALLSVDAAHEKVTIAGTLYFTATKAGETVPWLWRLENQTTSNNAVRVNTPGGFPVTGATNLFEFRGLSRLYFSCDGTGTEFVDEDAEDKRLRPRGRELWVTAE